jgi:ribosomal protein S18 acetylase RimI-like enzyme
VAAPNNILGVIEVGVQDEASVLRHLQPGVDTYGYVSSMAVAPALRRCGVGGALLQAAEQQAVLWGQGALALHVHTGNARAIRLYERSGLLPAAQDPAWRQLVGGKVRQLHIKYLQR